MDSYLGDRSRGHREFGLLISVALLSPAAFADDTNSNDENRRHPIVSAPIVIEAPDGNSTQATAVNNRGAVVGLRVTQEGASAIGFVWTRKRGLVDLETSTEVEFPFSIALAISECDVIVGQSNLPGALGSHAVRWVKGELEDLGTLGGSNSGAADVNERGSVVGFSFNSVEAVRAFLWTEEEGMIDLGTLGGDFAVADAINNRGEVVGASTTESGEQHAYVWSRRTGMVDLGTQGEEESSAVAINDRGEVAVLASGNLGNLARGFIWTRKRGFVELRDRVDFAAPMDINHRGIVAGTTKNENGNRIAALWPHPRRLIPIVPEVGETDSDAEGISDNWVAGTALFNGGETQRGVVWRLRAGGSDRHHERELQRLCRQSTD